MQGYQIITNAPLYDAPGLNSFCQSTQDYGLCMPDNSGCLSQMYGESRINFEMYDKLKPGTTNYISQDRNLPMSFSQFETDISNQFYFNNGPINNSDALNLKSAEEKVYNLTYFIVLENCCII